MVHKIVLLLLIFLISCPSFAATTREQKYKIFDAIIKSDAETVKKAIKNIDDKDELGVYLFMAGDVAYHYTGKFNYDKDAYDPVEYHVMYHFDGAVEKNKQKDPMAYAFGVSQNTKNNTMKFDKNSIIQIDEDKNNEIKNALIDKGARTDSFAINISTRELKASGEIPEDIAPLPYVYDAVVIVPAVGRYWSRADEGRIGKCVAALSLFDTHTRPEDFWRLIKEWKENKCSIEKMQYLGSFYYYPAELRTHAISADTLPEHVLNIGITTEELKNKYGKPTFYENHSRGEQKHEIFIYRKTEKNGDNSFNMTDYVYNTRDGIVTNVGTLTLARGINPHDLKENRPDVLEKLKKQGYKID